MLPRPIPVSYTHLTVPLLSKPTFKVQVSSMLMVLPVATCLLLAVGSVPSVVYTSLALDVYKRQIIVYATWYIVAC